MRILFLTDNYPPEVNAPATRTHSHCRAWVEAGAEVTVITGAPNFPQGRPFDGYTNRLYQSEVMDGVRVIRVWTYMAPNTGFTRRIIDYLSFAISGGFASLFQSYDVLIATSPQFFTAVAGGVVSTLRRKPWAFEVRDLWPESIVATGAMRRGLTIDILERLEMALYNMADVIVPVTQSFKHQLERRGVPSRKVYVVPNGVDPEEFRGGDPAVRSDGKRGSPFRVGYLGTHGLAHGLDLVLRTASRFDPGVVEFVLVGDGAEKERLVSAAQRRGIPNVRFEAPVPRQDVSRVLSRFDAALIPLRDSDTFRSVIPSKIFEAAAAGLPILLGVRGEAQELVETAHCGLPFEPENETDLERVIRRLMQDETLYAALKAGGQALASRYDRRHLADDMLERLRLLVSNSGDSR